MYNFLVSVIIPNYNHANYLEQRITSVLNQTYTHFEIVLLDDCSMDDSALIIEKYRNHSKVSHVVVNTSNSGSVFKQWEKGIGLANGDWIWIAESDDWAAPTFLETLVKQVAAGTGVIYSNSEVVDEEGRNLYTYFHDHGSNKEVLFKEGFTMEGLSFIRKKMLHSNSIPNASGVIFKKSLFYHAGTEYQRFKVNGDWLFWIQLLEQTSVAYVHFPLNYFRTHTGNVRTATYSNGTFLSEIFRIQQYLADYFHFSGKERRNLKYNMLNRLITETTVRGVSLSKKGKKECLDIINKVCGNVAWAAFKTRIVIQLRKWQEGYGRD